MASLGAPDIVIITFVFATLVIYMGMASDYSSQPIIWGAGGILLVPFYLIVSLVNNPFAIVFIPILILLFKEKYVPFLGNIFGEGLVALAFLGAAALWVGA